MSMNHVITASMLIAFEQHLRDSEKAAATIEKYLRDVTAFSRFVGASAVTKETLIAYKQHKSVLLRNHQRQFNAVSAQPFPGLVRLGTAR